METKYYQQKIEQGRQYEIWVCERWPWCYGSPMTHIIGEQDQYDIGDGYESGGLEIKNDNLIDRFHRIFIETHEKRKATNRKWVLSGIYKRAKYKWYLIGDYKRWYCFKRHTLITLDKDDAPWLHRPKEKNDDTKKGFAFGVRHARELCEFYQQFDHNGRPKTAIGCMKITKAVYELEGY